MEFRSREPSRRIEHVGRRGIASGDGVLVSNGLDDHAVFVAHLSHKFDPAGLVRTRHACRRHEILAQELKCFQEIWIACRSRDPTVKTNIRGDAIAACSYLDINSMERTLDVRKLRVRSALGGQCSRLRFNSPTQFDYLHNRFTRFNDRVVYLQGAHRGLTADKNPAALTRFDETPLLKPRNGLPHHGPADAKFRCERRLRRKLFSGLSCPDSIRASNACAT